MNDSPTSLGRACGGGGGGFPSLKGGGMKFWVGLGMGWLGGAAVEVAYVPAGGGAYFGAPVCRKMLDDATMHQNKYVTYIHAFDKVYS